MRVPRELLRDTITVEAYSGSGAMGPVFAESRELRASLQSTSRMMSDAQGERTLTIDTLAIIRPEDGPIAPDSRVDARGTNFRVIECYGVPDERRPSHYELLLARYSV